MKNFLPVFVVSACLFALSAAAQESTFHSIFTGTDLEGWRAPGNAAHFVATDGELLVVNSAKQKGDILKTEKEYADFHLKLDFKFGEGNIDSGIFIRNDKEQIQIGISGSLKRDMTASPYIPGKGYPVEAEGVKKLLKLHDWNSMQVRAVGNTYTTWLNGKEVMTYESTSAAKKGPIGIQLHGSREMQIRFRNLQVAEL